MKKNSNKKLVIKTLTVITLLWNMVLLSGCGSSKTINLNDYVGIRVSGIDTQGVASVDVDYEIMEEHIMDALNVETNDDIDNFESIGAALDEMEKLSNALDCFDFIVEPCEELKNGDKVRITAQIDKETADEIGLKYKFEEMEIEVTGLTEAVIISEDALFKDVEVSYVGVSPLANAEVKNNSTDPVLSQIQFYTMGLDNLEKGGVATVYASGTEVFEDQGYIFESTSKDYIVDKVDAYILDASEITTEQLQHILNLTEPMLQDLIGKKCEKSLWVDGSFWASLTSFETISTPTVDRIYYFICEDKYRSSWLDCGTFLGIIYKFDLGSIGGGWLEQPAKDFKDCFVMLQCPNVILTKDGEISFDVENAKFTNACSDFESIYNDYVEAYNDSYPSYRNQEVNIEGIKN